MELKHKDCAPDASPEAKRQLFAEASGEGIAQIKDGGYGKKIH